jgi:hypothetical protein
MSFNKRYITSESIKSIYQSRGAQVVYDYIRSPDAIISDNSKLFIACHNAVKECDFDKLKKVLEQIEPS